MSNNNFQLRALLICSGAVNHVRIFQKVDKMSNVVIQGWRPTSAIASKCSMIKGGKLGVFDNFLWL